VFVVIKDNIFADIFFYFSRDDLLEELMLKLMLLEDGLMPHPIESFRNRSIFKKVEDVYMIHADAMS
jgi:hypothetical protein